MLTSNLKSETILHALYAHIQSQGNATAYTFLKSENERLSLTYRELDQRARSIAQGLLRYADPGDRALMMYPAGLDFIEAFLGCLYAGIVAVPAYPPLKNRNAERILAIAKDCCPHLLLCSSETKHIVKREIADPEGQPALIVTDELEYSSEFSPGEIIADQLAFLQYTSGSTASPKGVMVSHGNIVANECLIEKYFELSRESILVSWLPMFHDMGLIGGVLAPLFVGFHSVLMSPTSFLWSPRTWLQAISEYRGTVTGAPNFAYELCAARMTDADKEKLDLSSLRIAFNGSEPVRAETLRNFSAAFAGCGFHPNVFFPCYGMAEATLFVSGGPPLAVKKVLKLNQSELEKNRIVESSDGPEIVSCGQISNDLPVRIVDPESLTECPFDKVGEIWITGKSISRGYHNRTRETTDAFGFSLDAAPGIWFRTGDYGFIRDNELFITGRLKDMLIIRGRNIYPQDIEQKIAEIFQLDSPNSVAAFMVELEGRETIGIVVEASTRILQLAISSKKHLQGELDEQLDAFRDLIRTSRQWVNQNFEATLSRICFVKPGGFPRTSSGKVMRSRVQNQLLGHHLDLLTLPMCYTGTGD
jgi:acyl-CoA synthetase (AMP-forming)/AMP-acid ligase II